MRRRILTSLLIMLLAQRRLPPDRARRHPGVRRRRRRPTRTRRSRSRWTARDQSPIGGPITSFTTGAPAHGIDRGAGTITCDTGGAKKCHADVAVHAGGGLQRQRTRSRSPRPARTGLHSAIVSITITAVNDAPVCSGDASSGDEDTDQTGNRRLHRRRRQHPDLRQGRRARPTASASVGVQRRLELHARPPTTTAPTASRSAPTTAPSTRAPARCPSPWSRSTTRRPAPDDSSSGVKNQQQTGTVACTDVDERPAHVQQGRPARRTAPRPSPRTVTGRTTRPTTTAARTASRSRPTTGRRTRTTRRWT